MTPLVLLGDSHVRIYAQAIRHMQAPIIAAPLGSAHIFAGERIASHGPEGLQLQGVPAERFKLLQASTGLGSLTECEGRLVLSLGLAAPLLYGTTNWRRSDFGPRAEPRKRYISSAVMAATIRALQTSTVEFMDQCVQAGLLIAVTAAPRPQARHIAAQILGPRRLLDLVQRFEEPVRVVLAARGVPLIEPVGTTSEDGLLLEEFWGEDDIHANLAYGRLVIEALLQVTRRGPWAAAQRPLA